MDLLLLLGSHHFHQFGLQLKPLELFTSLLKLVRFKLRFSKVHLVLSVCLNSVKAVTVDLDVKKFLLGNRVKHVRFCLSPL